MPKWTTQQQQAIESTGGSVLVSAAAGSGKTAVLVERVIRMITRAKNPVDADRLLIVTFTRDAAAEMQQRIAVALTNRLEQDPCNPQLLRQRQLLYNASISTIDSFCANIIREYFHVLDISPDFRTAEQGELELLKADALNTAIEYFYAQDDPDFRDLLDVFSSRDGDKNLRKTVFRVQDFLDTQPFPEEWMDNMCQNYRVDDIAGSLWGGIMIDYAHAAVSHGIVLAENAIAVLREQGDEALNAKLLPVLEDDLSYITNVQKRLHEGDWDRIAACINAYTPRRLTAPRGYKEHPAKVAVADSRKEFKATNDKLKSCFDRTQNEVREELNALGHIVRTLFALEKRYLIELDALKRKKNILTFSDTELLTVRLLAQSNGQGGCLRTPQAREIAKRFDAVIVDEFQDVNDVQNLIFNCVSDYEENLFVVGDVKQSIYGFRQAKPNIFLDRRDRCCRYQSDAPQYPAAIVLDKNFRSRKEVCDTVNFIFERLMQQDCAKMTYNADEQLNVGAVYPEGCGCETEISIIEKSAFETIETPLLEAAYIAGKIKQMMGEGFRVTHDGQTRRVTFGDFAVMLRSPKSSARDYVSTLIANGVPAYCEESTGAFESQEVKLMLHYMRVVDNPSLDIPLLSVLCSPIYGFTPDELCQLRAGHRRESLYASLTREAEHNAKAAAFLSELAKLRAYAATSTVEEFVIRLFDVTAIGAITAAVRGGEHPLVNLNLLRYYAKSYQANGYKTLSDFIWFIDRMLDNQTKLPNDAAVDAESLNGVRVLSIHKSKGLEYPVCFLAETAKKFNKTDLRADVLIDSRAGLGIKRKSGVCRYDTLPRAAVGIEIERNEIAEELRVLYVALTRAREKLVIVGSVSEAERFLAKTAAKLAFGKLIEPYTVSHSGSILEWICLTALINPSTRMQMCPQAEPIILKSNYPQWQFHLIDSEEALYNEAETQQDEEVPLHFEHSPVNYAAILQKNLSFAYPNAAILGLPQKVSASEAAHSRNSDYFDKIIAKPAFLSRETAAAVERGTAHHLFLQYCDFEKASENMDVEIARLTTNGRLSAEQSALIDRGKLTTLLRSPLFDRVRRSDKVYREERFAAEIKPSLVYEEYEGVDTGFRIMLQGAVDLAFEENGRLVIVDYKTDRVRDMEKLRTLYQKQLMLYSEALRQSLGMEVSECIICSVHLNDYLTI